METPEFKKKTFALMMPFWPTKGTIISGNIGHNRLIVKSLKIFCDNITIRHVAAPDHVHILGAGEGGAVAASLARLLARPGKVPARVVACLEAAVVALDQFLVTPKEHVMIKFTKYK